MSVRISRRSLVVIAIVAILQAASVYAVAYSQESRVVATLSCMQLLTAVFIILLGCNARGFHLPYVAILAVSVIWSILDLRVGSVLWLPHFLLFLAWVESWVRHRGSQRDLHV